MSWSAIVFVTIAFLVAHIGGTLMGKFATKKGWTYGVAFSTMLFALGAPYMLAVVLWIDRFPDSRAGQLLALGIFPTIIYGRMRIKRVLFPDLKWNQEPPRGS